MKKKMVGIFVCMLLIAATGITVAGTFKQTRDITIDSSDVEVAVTDRGEPQYNPAGSWMRSDKQLIGTLSPAGPTGLGRYTMSYEYIHDPTWPALGPFSFPTAVGATDGRGDFVRTGKNTYDYSLLAIGFDEDYEFVYFSVYSGTAVITSDNTMECVFYLAFYSPDQDPFGENPPMYCFGPYDLDYERIPVVPPCGS